MHDEGKRVIGCMHPHGVFPFVSVCAVTSTLQARDGFGDGILDLPTAVANVIRTMPILKDVVGVFGIIPRTQEVACGLVYRGGHAHLALGPWRAGLCFVRGAIADSRRLPDATTSRLN